MLRKLVGIVGFRLAAGFLLGTAMCAYGGGRQSVLLATGFVMEVDSVERQGAECLLRSAGGESRLPCSQIVEMQVLEARAVEARTVEARAVEARAVEARPLAANGDRVREGENAGTSGSAAPGIGATKTPQQLLTEAAERHGLPPEFVHSVARAESAYRVDAVSHKGAIGLMQLMPETARFLQVDPHDPEQNAEGGVKLLRQLLLKYQNYPDQVRRALSAYNAGEGAVARYNGVPPYRETQGYVEKILREYNRKLRNP